MTFGKTDERKLTHLAIHLVTLEMYFDLVKGQKVTKQFKGYQNGTIVLKLHFQDISKSDKDMRHYHYHHGKRTKLTETIQCVKWFIWKRGSILKENIYQGCYIYNKSWKYAITKYNVYLHLWPYTSTISTKQFTS